MELLREGDVIELKIGHTVYAKLPEHFVYENRRGVFGRLAMTEITIGTDKNGMSTDVFAGKYIVVKTAPDGGGTGHGPHDVYPDGHHVWAEQVGGLIAVEFYQTGAFTAMIAEIYAIGKATRKWELT